MFQSKQKNAIVFQMKTSLQRSQTMAIVWISLFASRGAFGHADEGPLAGHSFHGEAYDEGPRQAAYLMEGMPKVNFPVTTTNALAQKFFNQGVGQLHGFWHFEAERSFRQVAVLDTNCVMAQWGMAMANVYNETRASDLIASAVTRTNSVTVTRREQLYLDSLAKFYADNKKSEAQKAEEKIDARKGDKYGPGASKPGEDGDPKAHREYVRSLEQIIEEFPDDLEAKAFLTFKIWDNGGRLKISSHMATEALAQQVLAVNPLHPVQHARIHFWNGEADRRALDAAARCGQGSPGIAHMWHMPGHTYSALHRYADGAWQQEASARVDHAYMIKNHVLPDQIHNFAHNNDWLVKNLNHLGRVKAALDLAKNMVELPRHPRYNNISSSNAPSSSTNLSVASVTANKNRENSAVLGRARLLETLVRWELWDELLALGSTMYLDLTDRAEEQAKRIKALGLASFAQGDAAAGAQRIAELEAVLKAQRELRHSDTDEAEARARRDKLPDDQVAKAMNDAMQTHADRLKSTEKAIAELRLYEALTKSDNDETRKLAEDIKDVSKERLAQLWLRLGDKEKAMKLAKEAVDGATNQVQVLANCVDILAQCGKSEEATMEFGRLRAISTHADLDMPLLRRLQPLAKQLHLPEDWRPAFIPPTDVGERPPLDSLGPFRWHPSPAPDFELAGADGQRIALKDFKGRPVLVIFYLGYGCKHCLEQLNAFAPMTRRFADSGVSILAVSSDSPSGLEKTFKQSAGGKGFAFPIVSNESMDVFKQYRAYDDFEDMPLHGTFLIDGDGLVRWQDISFEPFTQVDFLLNESQRLLKLPARPTLVTSASGLPDSGTKGTELLRQER